MKIMKVRIFAGGLVAAVIAVAGLSSKSEATYGYWNEVDFDAVADHADANGFVLGGWTVADPDEGELNGYTRDPSIYKRVDVVTGFLGNDDIDEFDINSLVRYDEYWATFVVGELTSSSGTGLGNVWENEPGAVGGKTASRIDRYNWVNSQWSYQYSSADF